MACKSARPPGEKNVPGRINRKDYYKEVRRSERDSKIRESSDKIRECDKNKKSDDRSQIPFFIGEKY